MTRRWELAVATAAAWIALAIAFLPPAAGLHQTAAVLAVLAAAGALAIRWSAAPPRIVRWTSLGARLLLVVIGALVVFSRQFPLVRYDAAHRTGSLVGTALALAAFVFLAGRRVWRVHTHLVPTVAGLLVAAGMERSGQAFVPLAALAGVALWVDGVRSGGPRRFGVPLLAAGLAGLGLAAGLAWLLPVAQPHVQDMVARAYGEAQTGLSNRSELGEVASLARSRRVVARVWTDRPQLLRMQVFSQFDGRRWAAFAGDGRPMRRVERRGLGPILGAVPGTLYADPAATVEPAFVTETRVLPDLWMDDGWGLLAPAGPLRVVWPHEGLLIDDRGLVTTGGATARLYGVVNRPLEGTRVPPGKLDLALPARLDPRIRALARSLQQGERPSPPLVARTVEHLRNRYHYTLDVGRFETDDPLAEFLFDKQAGYCEYFATAAVVLLRAQGVPARYVKGVSVRSDRRIGEHYVVRESDAHAWVDAWTDETGWTEVDPTPADGWALTHPEETPGTFEVLWEHASAWASQVWARWRQGTWPSVTGAIARAFQDLARAVRDERVPIAITALLGLACLAIARRRRPRPRAIVQVQLTLQPGLAAALQQVERHWTRAGHARPPSRGLLEHLEQLPGGALSLEDRALSRQVVDAVYLSAFAGRPLATADLDAVAAAARTLAR